MSDHVQYAERLVLQAGELLLEYSGNKNLRVDLKSDRSVVTEADLAADKLISEALKQRYPEDGLLSEENVPQFGKGAPGTVWIVDPLDGTTNFSLGIHYWGVLLTRVVDGWPQLTVMYFPQLRELYKAWVGGGAHLNGERVYVNPPDPRRPFSFFTCCSRTFSRYHVNVRYKARILGCAAYSYCALVRGSALLAFEATPKIWDIAGAWLLVTEAGGTIGPLSGESPFPLQAGKNLAEISYPTLAAATPKLFTDGREQITPRDFGRTVT